MKPIWPLDPLTLHARSAGPRNRRSRAFLLIMRAILVLTGAWLAAADTPNVLARNPVTLAQLARQLVADLNTQQPLSGHAVQVSENAFWERETHINLPFSSALCDALSAALADKGVTVTVQEVGREPLTLVGNYGTEGRDLVVTLRLRKMGESHSADLAIARGLVTKGSLDPAWFQRSFPRVARTLVRMLENNYTGMNTLAARISPLQPGVRGQPPLLLGQQLQQYLTAAAAQTAMFSPPRRGAGDQPVELTGTYSILNERLSLHIAVLEENGHLVTDAAMELPLTDVPPDLLKPMANTDMDACIIFVPSGSGGLSQHTTAVSNMINGVSDILSDHGIVVRPCATESSQAIQVEIRMHLRERQTGDGYRMATGTMSITAMGGNRRTLGTINRKGKAFFEGNLESAVDKISGKILQEEAFRSELANMVLGR